MRFRLLLVFLLSVSLLPAQSPDIKLRALEDSFLIGQSFDVELLIKHDGSKAFEFFESNNDQLKFEIVSKKFFATKKINELIYQDSVLLEVRSFSIEDSLLLWVSLFQTKKLDTVIYKSPSIWIKQKSPVVGGEYNKLLFFTEYLKIEKQRDKKLYLFFVILLGVGVASFLWFGLPKIISKIRRKKFIEAHQIFVSEMNQFEISDKNDLDRMIALWKKDLRNSTGLNYTALTINQLKNEIASQKESFVLLESMLYSNEKLSENAKNAIDGLLAFSENQYLKKLEAWK